MRAAHGGNFFRRAAGYDAAAMRAPFGSQVDNEIGALDHVEIVLDDDHRIAQAYQPLKHVEQLVNVGKMKSGSRLIENVNRSPGGPLGEFLGQLNPLRLAAGKRRG